MKSLQRLQQSRPERTEETPRPQARIHRLRTNAVRRGERARWIRRLRRFCLLVGIAFLVVAAVAVVSGSRMVAGGIVRGGAGTVVAPIDARVAKWLVAPGAPVRIGDPLVTLIPDERGEGRSELVAELRAREAALEWLDAGGDTAEFGRELRADRSATASRNLALSEAEAQEARARIAVRSAELEAAIAAHAEVTPRWKTRFCTLEATRKSLKVRETEALVQLDLAQRQRDRARQLVKDRVQSERGLDEADVALSMAREALGSVRAEQAVAEAQLAEAEHARRDELAQRGRAMGLARTQLEEARSSAAAAGTRMDAWRAELAHHRALEPQVSRSQDDIRSARRKELLAQVDRAKAEIETFDARYSPRTVRAESVGRVDELLVGEGAILRAGTPLMRVLDSDRSLIVVYAPPSAVEYLSPGNSCRVRTLDDGRTVIAHIVSVGTARVHPPEEVARFGSGQAVAISLAIAPGQRRIGPGAHVRAAFRTDPWTAFQRRVNRWLTR